MFDYADVTTAILMVKVRFTHAFGKLLPLAPLADFHSVFKAHSVILSLLR